MLNSIHFILTYTCNFECDHCFLYCSPQSRGTFTITQVKNLLDQAEETNTIEWIFFEGGEPLMFFPLLKESIFQASSRGFKVGVVTNAYGANSREDARLWLAPLAESGLNFLSASNDEFHYGEDADNPASIATAMAEELKIKTSPIAIEPPKVTAPCLDDPEKGQPVVGGTAMFRGRAVEKLVKDLPCRPWEELNTCPHEELASPSRVHIDPMGNVHLCQGISMGNVWKESLSQIVNNYQPDTHPIAGPIIQGGPAQLARAMKISHGPEYVDECHLCYETRRSVIDRFPNVLEPRQVYGLT